MGYFSNGSAGYDYEEEFCGHCIHGPSDSTNCPILELHGLWNYEAVNDPVKNLALDMFIPRKGMWNEQCKMFVPKENKP